MQLTGKLCLNAYVVKETCTQIRTNGTPDIETNKRFAVAWIAVKSVA
jgi:hypothetical protein